MFRYHDIAPAQVHDTLRQHLLVDGYPLVVDLEGSRGSTLRCLKTGKTYLDFFSFFASNPIGFNHPRMLEAEVQARLARASTVKVSNADYYTTFMAEFVETLGRTAGPPELPSYFFIDGGALAVENGMKAAFDWKVRKNLAAGRGERGSQILHFTHAFHGRSGYTLSVTNTDPVKTDYFPKFPWPRVSSPACRFPLEGAQLEATLALERQALAELHAAFDAAPHDIAGILIEPIQAEGGDRHFRPEFLQALRRVADEREALLIFDEVQTGLGLTGQWWAFQSLGVVPDIVCFAKKMQVGGILAGPRVREVPNNVFEKPSRINSTWGGSLTDMVRCTHILEIIVNDGLLQNCQQRGEELLAGLQRLTARFDGALSNARGRGLMCAIDLPSRALRSAVLARCFEDGLLLLPCGERSIRFRPALTVDEEAIAEGLLRLERALDVELGGA